MKTHGWAVARFAALAALLLGVTLVAPVAAKSDEPRPAAAAAAPQNPVLTGKIISRGGAAETRSLKISRLDVNVDVAGRAARTVVTATFLNPTGNIIEGDFLLDMPAGSVVTGYALDVEDRMVEGVLVGRRQGTQAYEARVRAGVDPGLAEVTRTGAFRTRVFPIFPGKGRTVRIEFVSPIGADGYVLPLRSDEPIGEMSMRMTGEPGPYRLGAERQPRTGTDGAWRARDVRLTDGLRIPSRAGLPAVTAARHDAGETFVEILDRAPSTALRAPDTQRVRIYWDRSLSRRDDNLDAEIALVRRYLETVRPQAVDLITFASDQPGVQTFDGPGLEARVVTALKAVDYAGATSLQRVMAVRPPPAGQCLAFTDGNVNLDDYDAVRMPCTAFAISSAADADRGWLGAMARRSGGEHLDLSILHPEQALARLTSRALRVEGVRGREGQDIDYIVLPASEDSFRIVARAPESGPLVVQLSGQPARTYAAPGGRVAGHDGLGALWARAQLAEMSSQSRPDDKAVQRFARRYSVADGSVVFLVLERAADYADAEIDPPDSIGKGVIEEYRRLLAKRAEAKAAERRGRLDKVVAMWAEQKAWWEMSYQFPREKLEADGRRGGDRDDERRLRGEVTGAPPPPPPPPPSAPPPPPSPVSSEAMAAPSAGQSMTEDVVVTGSRVARPADGPPSIAIEVGEWNPDRPYLKALQAAPDDRFWDVYRAQAGQHGDLPAFYFDVAEWLHRKGATGDALTVVVNAIELPVADTTTLTLLADRLMRYGDEDRAIWVYEKILSLEPDRPQPSRNLALALISRAERNARSRARATHDPRADMQRALDLLTEVVMRPWEGRYDGVEMISLMEANRIVPTVRGYGGKVELDPRLIALLDTDLRIILEWNTDHTDMDLWVDEPSGERAIYSHPRTVIGGRLSNDMTQGYGPEEYLLRRSMPGEYRVSANVYANDRMSPNGSTTIRARIFRNWGRPGQAEQVMDLELRPDEKGTRLVGRITVGPPARR